MSEMKRVEITTVPPSQKQKKVLKKKVTYRFDLTLGESNATTCPEFSFADLIKNLRPINGHGNAIGNFDDEDNSDVAAIAQRFEAKYGPKSNPAGKKKWTQDMDDYYDLGDGYDEDDPFIDNTEAYDEVVPSTLTTQHGGFYINQGKLDFKSLTYDSSDEFTSPKSVKKKKKRVLDSDSDKEEEETGEALSKKFKAMKRKKLLESKEGEKKKRKTTIGTDGEVIVKKKKKKNLERLKRIPGSSSPQRKEMGQAQPASPPAPPVIQTPTITITSTTPATTKTTATVNLINGTTNMEPEVLLKDFKLCMEETFSAILQEAMKDDSSSKSNDEGKGEQQSGEKNTQLPSQLPTGLAEAIDIIKKEARESKEGKSKFFSADINKLLLDIELGSRSLAWGSRTAIYKHLSEHLPCGANTLQRRAKKLREVQQEDQLKVPTQKLKDAIMKEMPALEEQHEQDVAKAKSEAELNDGKPETTKEEASTESDEEEKSENKKKTRGPRRKFLWTKETKDLLLEIVSRKMKLFNTCKTRNQSAEDYLKAYLDSDIKPIWPQGWMQTRMLFKESRAAHEELTRGTQQSKQKKATAPARSSSPSPDVGHSLQELNTTHVSKTEHVIEITDDRTDTVVVNLPNSDVKPLSNFTTLTPASKLSDSSHSDAFSAFGRAHNNKPPGKQAGQPWVALTPPSSVSLPPKYNESTNNASAKRITPVQISENSPSAATPMSPSVQRSTSAKPFPQGGSSPIASSAVGDTSPTPGASISTRSFLSAFESFANTYTKPDSTSSLTPVDSQQKHQNSIVVPSSSQSKVNSHQSQQKAPSLQSKPVVQPQMVSTQHKLPQEQKVVISQQQKAAARSSSSVVNKDIPNSSWNNTSPAGGKASTPSPKHSATLIDKNNKLTQLVQKQVMQRATVSLSPTTGKTQQNNVSKKRQQFTSSGSTNLNSPSHYHQAPDSRAGTISSFHPGMSSKPDLHMQQRNSSPAVTGASNYLSGMQHSSNQQLKSATVIGAPNMTHKSHLQVMRVLGTPSQLGIRANSDVKSGKQSSSQGTINQSSPPRKFPQSSSTSSPVIQSGLLQSSPLISQSRGSTPSPQKSPMSPENAALSLYEQMQSQIRNQEAMEGQALKNLAMALNYSSASANAGFLGMKPATIRDTGKSAKLNFNEFNKATDGPLKHGRSLVQDTPEKAQLSQPRPDMDRALILQRKDELFDKVEKGFGKVSNITISNSSLQSWKMLQFSEAIENKGLAINQSTTVDGAKMNRVHAGSQPASNNLAAQSKKDSGMNTWEHFLPRVQHKSSASPAVTKQQIIISSPPISQLSVAQKIDKVSSDTVSKSVNVPCDQLSPLKILQHPEQNFTLENLKNMIGRTSSNQGETQMNQNLKIIAGQASTKQNSLVSLTLTQQQAQRCSKTSSQRSTTDKSADSIFPSIQATFSQYAPLSPVQHKKSLTDFGSTSEILKEGVVRKTLDSSRDMGESEDH